jgi:hypothetical protein
LTRAEVVVFALAALASHPSIAEESSNRKAGERVLISGSWGSLFMVGETTSFKAHARFWPEDHRFIRRSTTSASPKKRFGAGSKPDSSLEVESR